MVSASTLTGRLVLVVAACALLAGCTEQDDSCGNGFVDNGEVCDGYILGTNTCESAGFAGGSVSCRANCTLDTSGCFEEGLCEPSCDAASCEICQGDTCVTSCGNTERCDGGTCVSAIETLTFFVTSDEHGWMFDGLSADGETMWGGAADMLGRLREFGYDPDSNESILISDGDMWTGPAVSTWFDGESMVEVMNAMGYSAAALGNHEFDFGQDVLATRAEQADFPFLAANLTIEATGEPPEYASPFVVVEVNGIQVGIIGLVLEHLTLIVMSSKVEGLVVDDYESALRATVPEALEAGAEVLIVAAHVCEDDLLELTPVAAELGISLMTAGHCHDSNVNRRNNLYVVSAGANMVGYAAVDLEFDTNSREVVGYDVELIENYYPASEENPVEPDAEVAAIVARWQGLEDEALGEVIGYTVAGIPNDWGLQNLVVDSWLWKLPDTDLAMINPGSYRASIDVGDITLADVLTVQPFENELLIVTVTGEQVVSNLTVAGPTRPAGLSVDATGQALSVTLSDGSPIDSTATYNVVVTDYVYDGGGGYLFADQDPTPQYTGVYDRDPTIDWIREQNTSSDQPLELLLDNSPRWIE